MSFLDILRLSALVASTNEIDRFFYKVVDAQLHFERDEEGLVKAVVLHQNGEQRAPK